jgi:hypothetical protein
MPLRHEERQPASSDARRCSGRRAPEWKEELGEGRARAEEDGRGERDRRPGPAVRHQAILPRASSGCASVRATHFGRGGRTSILRLLRAWCRVESPGPELRQPPGIDPVHGFTGLASPFPQRLSTEQCLSKKQKTHPSRRFSVDGSFVALSLIVSNDNFA